MNRRKSLISILFLMSMMLNLAVLPAFAGRTPKNDQVFVKVLYSNGKPAGKVAVMLFEGDDWSTATAKTRWVITKGNGMAVISLTQETNFGSWSPGDEFTVHVLTSYTLEGYKFHPNSFYGTFSANIEVTIPELPQ